MAIGVEAAAGEQGHSECCREHERSGFHASLHSACIEDLDYLVMADDCATYAGDSARIRVPRTVPLDEAKTCPSAPMKSVLKGPLNPS